MVITTYEHACDFLAHAQAELERNEVLNSLPLGIALRLQRFPERIKSPPYLATIEEEGKLILMAVMTPPFGLVVTSNQMDVVGEAPSLLVHDLLKDGWPVSGVMGPSTLADLFAQTWTSLSGEMPRLRTHERLFELRHVIAPRPGPGSLRLATSDDTALLVDWIKAFREEASHEFVSDEEALTWAQMGIDIGAVYLWELLDRTIVSLVGTTRPLSHVISIAPVYTPPEQRGRGYASRCVAALSQHLLDCGWERCCLFTDLANPISNSIYQQLGYQPVYDFNEYEFLHS